MTQIAMTQTHAAQDFSSAVQQIKGAVARYVGYRHTLAELRALPMETLWDLDIDPTNLKQIAWNATHAN